MALLLSGEIAVAQYAGPSILSRGGNQPGRRGRAPVNFTGYFGTHARYETGLLVPARAVNGLVPSTDDFGYGVEGGLYGGHDWRRQSVGLDYRGDYRWQRTQTAFNGTNHVLSFNYLFRPTKRLQFIFQESGGTTNRAFGSFAAPTFQDSTQPGIPLAELFDVRTYFAQSGVTALWSKSPRLQIALTGTAFFVKRDAVALINSQGFDGRASAMYRMNRTTSAGLEYHFYKFDFPRSFAGTEAQGPALRWKRTIGRKLTVEGMGGILLLNSFGVQQQKLSPEVAEILGRPTTLASYVRNDYLPNVEASATYSLLRGVFRANFATGIGSGNGIYLATKRTAAGVGYSYMGIRRTSVAFSSSYTRTESASLDLSSYNMFQVGTSGAYKLTDSLNLTGSFDFRNLQGLATQGRKGFAVMFGLSYSTSHLPLSIW
jgi:hypothetical protein